MDIAPLLSAIAANRKQFFDLVASLENVTHADIDDMELTAIIDGEHAGEAKLTRSQAHAILLQVSRRRGRRF